MENGYGITITDDHMHVYYGNYGNSSYGELKSQYKLFAIPWKQSRHKEYALLNLDGSLYKYIVNNYKHVNDDDLCSSIDPNHESISFIITDNHDDSVVTATCKLERRVWTKGSGIASWLKYFYPDSVSVSLDVSYDAEVGSKKGSWKGGVIGTSIEVNTDETLRSAFKRLCARDNLKFIGNARNADEKENTNTDS